MRENKKGLSLRGVPSWGGAFLELFVAAAADHEAHETQASDEHRITLGFRHRGDLGEVSAPQGERATTRLGMAGNYSAIVRVGGEVEQVGFVGKRGRQVS